MLPSLHSPIKFYLKYKNVKNKNCLIHDCTIMQYNTIIQYNNLFAFPCEIRLQEIYIHIFFFYDKMLSNFEICKQFSKEMPSAKMNPKVFEFSPRLAVL